MTFWDSRFRLAARKRVENWKILWWNSETLAFDWLRGNVRKIKTKYFVEISRHSVLIGCEETCGKLKNTSMKIWDTHFWLAAMKRSENLKKFSDEISRHSVLIGCEETCGNLKKKYFDEIWRHSVLIGSEETCGKLENTFMKFWDTHFWLAAKKCAEKLKNTLMKFWDTRIWLAARKCAEKMCH